MLRKKTINQYEAEGTKDEHSCLTGARACRKHQHALVGVRHGIELSNVCQISKISSHSGCITHQVEKLVD